VRRDNIGEAVTDAGRVELRRARFREPSARQGRASRECLAASRAEMSGGAIWRETATDLTARIRSREISAVEVMDAHLERIEQVNPLLNAIVTLDADGARRAAAEADRSLAAGAAPGLLHGLPIAVKDLVDTAGMRTTYGSPIYRDHVPREDALLVARLRRAGAIVIGKTNTPEFGAGSQTFNPVFGATRNPYDPSRTSGGSSGGAAAAVAAGMLPFADGSDLGASVRNPASFCNVVGLRPTPGRIPDGASRSPWDSLGVLGTLARTVADATLLLRALCGPDPSTPLSLQDPAESFAIELALDSAGHRVAWSRNLSDLPVAPEVTAVLDERRRTLEAMGCIVEDVEPDLSGADEAFETLRALGYAQSFGALLASHGDQLKETVAWNTRVGLSLTGQQVARALTLQAAAFHSMRQLLDRYDALALPVSQVAPFPVDEEWVRAIVGVAMGSYIEWMRSCSRISVTAHPAISVPAGFTPDALPVGLQLVGRYRGEISLLRLAAAFEEATRTGRHPPPL
jgi:amidase